MERLAGLPMTAGLEEGLSQRNPYCQSSPWQGPHCHTGRVGVKEESGAGVVIRGFCSRGLPGRARCPSEEKLSGEEGDQQMETQRGNKQ